MAATNGAEILILGAFGCGAFCNQPAVVARAFKTIQEKYASYFETIEYAVLCESYPFETEIIDGILDLILETLISKKTSIVVSGQEYPAALIKSKFMKLNYSHI